MRKITKLTTLYTNRLNALLMDKSAIAAIEYTLIAGLIGLVIIASFKLFASDLHGLFSNIGKRI